MLMRNSVLEPSAEKSEPEKPVEEPTILLEKNGPITLIAINRPHVRNCINSETGKLLCNPYRYFVYKNLVDL